MSKEIDVAPITGVLSIRMEERGGTVDTKHHARAFAEGDCPRTYGVPVRKFGVAVLLVAIGAGLFFSGWALGARSHKADVRRKPNEGASLLAALGTGSYPKSWIAIDIAHDPDDPAWVEFGLSGRGAHASQVQSGAGIAVHLGGGQWRIIVEPTTIFTSTICDPRSSSFVPLAVRAVFGLGCGLDTGPTYPPTH